MRRLGCGDTQSASDTEQVHRGATEIKLVEIDFREKVETRQHPGRREACALASDRDRTGRDTETRGHQKETGGDRDLDPEKDGVRRRDARAHSHGESALGEQTQRETEAEKLTAREGERGVTEAEVRGEQTGRGETACVLARVWEIGDRPQRRGQG